jgi:glucose-6-phosphate isomerase
VGYRDQKVAEGFTDAVVLGMGGSSLAPDVLRATFETSPPTPLLDGEGRVGLRLHVLDTTDPTTVLNLERALDLSKTLFLVASKSGGTLEVNAFYKYFRAKVDSFAHDEAGRHFVAITDEGTGLQQMAAAENFSRVFINPTDIGGRYSALSFFGLVPAALQGLDIETLLKRASQMAAWCKVNSAANPGLYLGALMGGMALHGQDKVSFVISPKIGTFGYWVEQLIAESTGKQGRGIVPVEGDLSNEEGPLKANPAGLSEDRFYVHLKLAGETVNDKFVAALKKAGQPVLEIVLNDVYDLGAEFFRWEFATAIAGAVLGVDPFDEPNVTESKQNTKKLLDEFEHSGVFASELTSKSPNGAISKHMRTAKNGDYLSLQAYLPYTAEVAAALAKMRLLLREKSGVPVTVGYGPRFLHSTGQLHKGGANNVVAVQLTYDPLDEALIPGEPFSFATLIRAQALGDFESLQTHNRRVIRLHLGEELGSSFRKILKVLNNAPVRARSKGKPGRKPKVVTEAKAVKTKPAAKKAAAEVGTKQAVKPAKAVAKKRAPKK